jgi:hypothetical protein
MILNDRLIFAPAVTLVNPRGVPDGKSHSDVQGNDKSLGLRVVIGQSSAGYFQRGSRREHAGPAN